MRTVHGFEALLRDIAGLGVGPWAKAHWLWLVAIVAAVILTPLSVAAGEINIQINGRPLALNPAPVIVADYSLAPLDQIGPALGARAYFDRGSGVARVFHGDRMVQLRAEEAEAVVGQERVALPVTPRVFGDRLFVPLRWFAETLGATVEWDGTAQAVIITASGAPVPEPEPKPKPVIPYTEEELDLLTRVISAEAGYQPFEGQVAVGAVVVNRVKYQHFPNTIMDVLKQPGQFGVVWNGMIDRPVVESARRAALEALHGSDPSQGALYFFNPQHTSSSFLLEREVTAEIGDHRFAR